MTQRLWIRAGVVTWPTLALLWRPLARAGGLKRAGSGRTLDELIVVEQAVTELWSQLHLHRAELERQLYSVGRPRNA
jgi:hypothetical protein